MAYGVLESAVAITEEASQAFYTFQPRPNDVARYDQQEGFIKSQTRGVAAFIGGNGAGTTECAMHKLARFVMETEPPRKDTPFWIIGDTYEQAMKVCWKEKLYNHGHLPRSEIDFSRIHYYRPHMNWPYLVPLKEWPTAPGKNWVLEFKSYDQGRALMQAASIGGFCFTEQFPWSLLTEVIRGCREYNFPGSKFCEFTPVDPALSWELENMQRESTLPPGWEIYRANTEVALEYGHVDRTWYEEFFGMMAPEEVEVRKIGAWASFAGQIYQSFNPDIHTVTHIAHPPGVHYRRVIDWGAGPENAFVCLWGFRNGVGQWFIFDEYWSTSQQYDALHHLELIMARHPWPDQMVLTNEEREKMEGYYGTTWADPSSLDNIRLAMRLNFPIQKAANSIFEGIDCVRRHLKVIPALDEPRLIIDRKRCPNLFREMQTYHWEQGTETGRNPRDARPDPCKKDDHAVDALRYLLFSEEQYTGAQFSSQAGGYDPQDYGIQQGGPAGRPIERLGLGRWGRGKRR
jgi:hypothetical protein